MIENEQFIRQYSAHELDLRCYISSLVSNKSDVDDILQNAAALMWKKYEDRDPEAPFLAWALCFAYNAVRNYRQKLSTRKKYFSDELIESIATTETSQLEELGAQGAALTVAMRQLSQKDRLLVEHRYSTGGTVQDLAQKLGETPDALYKRLQRIREKLLKSIELEMKRA